MPASNSLFNSRRHQFRLPRRPRRNRIARQHAVIGNPASHSKTAPVVYHDPDHIHFRFQVESLFRLLLGGRSRRYTDQAYELLARRERVGRDTIKAVIAYVPGLTLQWTVGFCPKEKNRKPQMKPFAFSSFLVCHHKPDLG